AASFPSQGWPSPPPPYHHHPAFVCQNYTAPPPLPQRPPRSGCAVVNKLSSMTNLLLDAPHPSDGVLPPWQQQGAQYGFPDPQLCDLISSKFNALITSMDGEEFNGNENELAVFMSPHQPPQAYDLQARDVAGVREKDGAKEKRRGDPNLQTSTPDITTGFYFKKVNYYANARLSENLPPLKLLAAKYSEEVYNKAAGQERETQVEADWRIGTKAMVIKSVPMDAMNTIIFAIRGTQTFMDWAVNLKTAPTSPTGFLVSKELLSCLFEIISNITSSTPLAILVRNEQLTQLRMIRATYATLDS
ncbi:hypothetical protein DH86_00000230, partial [Scytalidium sp. 3C]